MHVTGSQAGPLTDHSPTLPANRTPPLGTEDMQRLLEERVPAYQYALDHERFEETCLGLLRLARPAWFADTHGAPPPIKLVQCKDGITNKRKMQRDCRD